MTLVEKKSTVVDLGLLLGWVSGGRDLSPPRRTKGAMSNTQRPYGGRVDQTNRVAGKEGRETANELLVALKADAFPAHQTLCAGDICLSCSVVGVVRVYAAFSALW
eukprot:GGOE01003764.1.p2 GENE.GGOE01003764.1~~GGOE01003764.1.p2  ORF type:complete len:106 (+),score=1.94 GGOE01003764.1:144-461(+)